MADPAEHAPEPVPKSIFRRHPWWTLGIYLLLVIASNITDWQVDEGRRVWGDRYIERFGGFEVSVDTSGLPVRVDPLAYPVIITGDLRNAEPPVLLMHGSPGAANGFEALAAELAARGRTAIWLDLPGFASMSEPWSRGRVFDDYSADTYADIMWRVLDGLGVDRAHLAGWSNSGAVGLRMIEAQPERAASFTFLAAVGSQDTEGTGDYRFEHIKYKIGKAILVWGAHLYPHFGIPGPMSERRAFLEFFDDTDQRPLADIMRRLDTPTMILHGRHDFLVPAWGAERHHELIPTSRLVMLDASHFIPFLQAGQAAEYMVPFMARHDTPGVLPETDVIDLAPVPDRGMTATALQAFARWFRGVPWWLTLPLFMVLTRVRPTLTTVFAGVMVGTTQIDFALAGLGVLLGRAWWCMLTGGLDHPTTVLGWLRSFGWSFFSFIIAWLLLGRELILPLTDRFGFVGLGLGFAASYLILTVLRHVWSWAGRMRLLGFATEARRQEYWPSWIRYLPCYITLPFWILKARTHPVPTAVNPGYARDGGIAEEKKHEILERLPHPDMLHARFVPKDEDLARRTASACAIVREDALLGGYPLIIKPDQGERGRGVRIMRSDQDIARYLAVQTEPMLLQQYHPGPVEVGILWTRDPATIHDPDRAPPHGRILSVNAKGLPTLVGDGKRTLGRLILAHPRHRVQADVFYERCKDRLHTVPADGEEVSLGSAGNHAQGAMFTDASRLITPELEARIDEIARSFVGGFDVGRFDVRCESEDSLMRGEGLGIIELNGVTSEPTAIYDPSWSIFRAQKSLWSYWSRVTALGIARERTKTGECMYWPEIGRVLIMWKLRAIKRIVKALLRFERPVGL
ncbi:MAG: alpha/beta fold hydrolase [Planctomycetota bacterium]